MGCYGIHAFSHSQYNSFLGQLCFAFGGHNEQFGTNEKLSWGAGHAKLDAWV